MASVAGKIASYRDWKNTDPCKGDVAVLKKDLDSMNTLMSEFLSQTSMGVEGAWSEEQLAIIDSGPTELTPALDALAKTIASLKKCKVDGKLKTPLAKADDNVRDSRQRIAEAPSIIPVLKAKIVLSRWRAEQVEALKAAREQWCGGTVKPGTVPDIFYASEDETGKTEWHFCNDVKVVTEGGSKPLVLDPENKAKKNDYKRYVETALKYPASEVQKAPKVDVKTIASGESKPPEPQASKPPEETKPAAETKPAEPPPEEKPAPPPEKEKEKEKPAPTQREKPPPEPEKKKDSSGDLRPED